MQYPGALNQRWTRRTFLKLAGASLGTAALAACAPAALPSQAPGDTAAAGAGPEKTVVVWSFWGTEDPAFIENQRKLAQPFMDAHPDIEVEPVPTSDRYNEKVLTMLAGGSKLDAVKINSSFLARFVAEGVLRPLDEMVEADAAFKLDEFYPYTIAQNCQIHNGKLYGLPNGESARVVYFNVDMFKEAGLADPAICMSRANGRTMPTTTPRWP